MKFITVILSLLFLIEIQAQDYNLINEGKTYFYTNTYKIGHAAKIEPIYIISQNDSVMHLNTQMEFHDYASSLNDIKTFIKDECFFLGDSIITDTLFYKIYYNNLPPLYILKKLKPESSWILFKSGNIQISATVTKTEFQIFESVTDLTSTITLAVQDSLGTPRESSFNNKQIIIHKSQGLLETIDLKSLITQTVHVGSVYSYILHEIKETPAYIPSKMDFFNFSVGDVIVYVRYRASGSLVDYFREEIISKEINLETESITYLKKITSKIATIGHSGDCYNCYYEGHIISTTYNSLIIEDYNSLIFADSLYLNQAVISPDSRSCLVNSLYYYDDKLAYISLSHSVYEIENDTITLFMNDYEKLTIANLGATIFYCEWDGQDCSNYIDKQIIYYNTTQYGEYGIYPQKHFTSINEAQEQSSLVYPNPTTGIVNISDGYNRLELYDVSSRLVYENNSGELSVSVGHLPAGLYMMKVYRDEKILYQKIYLEK